MPLHTSVLATEALDGLAIVPDGRYVDATFGAGGHTRQILERLGPRGRVIAFDVDPLAASLAPDDPRLTLIHANFRALADELSARSISAVDGVLYDLGVSSMQLDDPARGFSFRSDAPLDMRLDPTHGETAADYIVSHDEVDLADAIFRYGEERNSRRIARTLKAKLPRTTGELAALVAASVHVSGRRERIHPATKTFQALRIAVNDELGALRASLDAAAGVVRPAGRIAVISFHSLEDRIVKLFFREDARVHPLTRKPIVPSDEEVLSNPRARSAKLRVATVEREVAA
ncbi:MAG TPA: 16S rRNA (cytosine(1402)-N(4))-methyltransferase RsmH [Candidatus Lustribacter sp.]|nr:16S rRNA (cytosine(1402)-N(4))-methyltransferase RsmH [Candidatus Lustribacter sp.]